ncbi:hypothetical protein EVJ58_g1211 [Rhodofomes roseus]|uniref:Uncharacterized protein n=1 Tax=Rhodofomes roseus TaxID=34475 RepID=A0A4Y9Z0F5_9APHY|nr:hypothetical protein EVJ58_g1211 [Rhodofomes roseus]
MATLVRTQTSPPTSDATEIGNSRQQYWDDLQRSVPAPFPTRAEREQEELLHEVASESLQDHNLGHATQEASQQRAASQDLSSVGSATISRTQEMMQVTGPSVLGEVRRGESLSEDVMPSIVHVQNSCITTLNDLLSHTPQWRPIIPDRRHSMPPCSPTSPGFSAQPSSSLYTLVTNLRALDAGRDASSGPSSSTASDDAVLIRELQTRASRLTDSDVFAPQDVVLVRRLASLIGHFHRLAASQPTSSAPTLTRVASWGSGMPSSTPADPIAALGRELSDLQLARDASTSPSRVVSPVQLVEGELLWAQVDEELEEVLSLCRSRTSHPPEQPPDYEAAWYDVQMESEGLPQYEAGSSGSREDLLKAGTSKASIAAADTSSILERGSAAALSEKMRMDLEAVTLAIDRLYLVAPQLHNQRVELKKSKVEEMEKASRGGALARKGKQREREPSDAQELERMVDLIGRASERRITDQAVVLEGGLQRKLEQARQRDLENRDAFVESLLRHAGAGRLHSQDAVLTPPGSTSRVKVKDPEALLSLPEFMREAIPEPVQLKMQMENPTALLTLPEFVKEPIPRELEPLPAPAPPKRKNSLANLEVTYVAEYHETLQHVLVFLNIAGMMPGATLEAEVLPAAQIPGKASDGYECLILKCGLSTSPFLRLPTRVSPGKKEVQPAGQHFQVKLSVLGGPANGNGPSTSVHSTLMDASRLSAMRATSYVCASCSLPLVHGSQVQDYRDLPSEHWAELVDAWMCHSDQKLHENVKKRSTQGFWPTEGHALVGGSYILFEQSAMSAHNLYAVDPVDETKHDDWERVRCICGSIVGRRREHEPSGGAPYLVYRLAKYAIRPLSPAHEPPRIPLSAFVAEDMNEFVHAHATYRFVILDEEEERQRLLIWLFKPSMRLAYTTPTEYVMPKSASIHAAKVLFKILGPSAVYTDIQSVLNKYPGFPQAEHLYYPRDICRRLAGMLRESNTAYPEGMRTMTGLDVGWLQRA